VIRVEYGVIVSHPTSSEDPKVTSNASKGQITNNTTHAGLRAFRNWPEDERGRRHGKNLSSNIERDRRDGGIARESIEAFTDAEVRIFRARDLGVEFFHSEFRTNDEIRTLTGCY